MSDELDNMQQGSETFNEGETKQEAVEPAEPAGEETNQENGAPSEQEGGAVKRAHEEDDGAQAKSEADGAEPPAKRQNTGDSGAENTEPEETRVILVPSNLAGYIIGSKGDTIRRLEAKSGAKIKVAQGSDSPEREVTISGSAAAVEQGMKAVNEVIDTERERAKAREEDEKVVKDRIEFLCPRTRVGLIIGRGGEKIRELQEKSGAKIQVVQDGIPPYAEGKPVLLTGTRESVETARNMIRDVIGDGFILPSNYSLTVFNNPDGTIDMEVPAGTVGMIVGRSGDTIKNIQNESGAKVEMERADNNTPVRAVKISGEAEGVKKAFDKILAIIMEARRRDEQGGRGVGAMNMPTETHVFAVPANRVGLVIGKGGETIHKIQDKTGAKIQLDQNVPPGAMEKKFMITGTMDQIEFAKRMIWERVGEPIPMPRSFRVGGGPAGPGFGGPQGNQAGPPQQQFGGYNNRGGPGFNQGGYGGPAQQRQQYGQYGQNGADQQQWGGQQQQQQQGQWGANQNQGQGQWGANQNQGQVWGANQNQGQGWGANQNQGQNQYGNQAQQQGQWGQWGGQQQPQAQGGWGAGGEVKKEAVPPVQAQGQAQEGGNQWGGAWQQYYGQNGQNNVGQQQAGGMQGQGQAQGQAQGQGQGGQQGGDYSQQWAAYYQQYYNQQGGQAGQQQGQQQWTPEQIQQWYAQNGQQAPKTEGM